MEVLEKSVKKILDSITYEDEYLKPSEVIERFREIQPHVSIGMAGKFTWENTPYMREIVDHLDPYSPVTHITVMKGIRTGGTFILVHNGCPYIMKYRPANIMLMSANKELATKTIEGVDDGIDGFDMHGAGVRALIGNASGVKSNAKGDTLQGKKFAGGYNLFNFGGQSVDNMRQVTASIIIADEVDAYKYVSKEGGSFTEVMEDRASDAGRQKKVIYISSPRLESNSIIYAKYLAGDQRVYMVPCPCCGEFIEFVWNERNENNTRYGVIFDVKNNEVVEDSVRYRCGKCEKEFKEHDHKMKMLNSGHWQPSVVRQDKTNVSYRISALYAPITMDTWYEFAKRYQQAFPRGGIRDDAKFQSFVNSILGWPYRQVGIELKSTELQKNRRNYKIGECPFELSKKDNNGEIMIISTAVDLNGYENDARIDGETMAHSENEATYSIDAFNMGTFIPKVERDALARQGVDVGQRDYERVKYTYKLGVKNSVWDLLEEHINITYGKHDRKVNIIAIDVGSFNEYAMEFVANMKRKGWNILAVMGAKQDIFSGQSKTETAKTYMLSERGDTQLLNVNVIKDRLAKYMITESYPDDDGVMHQPKHHLNFPEYDSTTGKYTYRNYFAHYEAEAKKEKKNEGADTKFMWEKKRQGIQNHFFDVAVYNQFCQIYMADLICSNRNAFKVRYYGKDTIPATWENACRLIKESSRITNIPLS